jgi:hypothetical protein
VWQFPIASVVSQLHPDPLIELAYLTCMFENRKTEYDRAELAEYHNRQVLLHVQYQVRSSVTCRQCERVDGWVGERL